MSYIERGLLYCVVIRTVFVVLKLPAERTEIHDVQKPILIEQYKPAPASPVSPRYIVIERKQDTVRGLTLVLLDQENGQVVWQYEKPEPKKVARNR